MSVVSKEERQPAGGTVLVVLVGVVIAFLLYAALLNASKSGDLLSETSFLFATLIFYTGAGSLYLGFGVLGQERYLRAASVLMWIGLAANTVALGYRWYEAGHPPLTNIFEMLLSFVWALALLTVIAEWRYGVRVIGLITMPVAIVGVVLMGLMRNEVHPLAPLLQSNLLQIHVTLAVLAYAACALSFALAMMFLVKDKVATETFLAIASGSTLAIYGSIVLAFLEKWGGLTPAGWSPDRIGEVVLTEKLRFVVPLTLLSWLLAAAAVLVAVPVTCCWLAWWKKERRLLGVANHCVLVSVVMQGLSVGLLLVRTPEERLAGAGAYALFPTRLASSPFVLTGLVGGVFISLMFLLLLWRREELERLLPTAERLDQITYGSIALAFPLLTLTIATGAYWANQTWGSYWSWDPKETWAAITWLAYALYLHMRITNGWRGRRAAYFAIGGFAVVIFTFFGVSYLLKGMHAFL